MCVDELAKDTGLWNTDDKTLQTGTVSPLSSPLEDGAHTETEASPPLSSLLEDGAHTETEASPPL